MENYENLLSLAREACANSYSPYSEFPVGACVLYESDRTYTGCNIENASYGLALCAERCAMAKAISSGEKSAMKAIAVYSPKQKKCMPCGACRQWLFEFANGNEVKIILEDENSNPVVLSLSDIFPYGFKLEK